MSEVMVQTKEITKYFPVRGLLRKMGQVHAVEGVSITINEAESFGLVGESGCGKTTLSRIILNLIRPTSGDVYFRGKSVFSFNSGELKRFRYDTALVFQDPYSSLNPRMLVTNIIAEPLVIQGVIHGVDKDEVVSGLLERVGLKPEHLYRYPHEFSGGQRQRIAIARALAGDPKFIVLDEPTSALDVSVQAKILNLLNRLKTELNLTYLFISHNLDVVRYISNTIGVMYLGKLVEVGPSTEVFGRPLHPYTQGLLSAVPQPDPAMKKELAVMLKGEVPSALTPPTGCRFHPRCPFATPECKDREPQLREIGDGHYVACHLVE